MIAAFRGETSGEYEAKLRSYGVNRATYIVRPNRTTESYGLSKLLLLQSMGNEIGLHTDEQHLITPTDPAVTPADMESYITDWMTQMNAKGFKNLRGIVCRTAKIQEALIPTTDSYFTWRIGVPSGSQDYSATDFSVEAVNTLTRSSHNPVRLGLELTPEQVEESVEDTVIANAKAAIDSAVTNKGYLVLYGHYYNDSTAVYCITERVLDSILAYLQSFIISGKVVVGGTTDILNYYYSKRNYEQ